MFGHARGIDVGLGTPRVSFHYLTGEVAREGVFSAVTLSVWLSEGLFMAVAELSLYTRALRKRVVRRGSARSTVVLERTGEGHRQ